MSGSILQANFYVKKDDQLPSIRSVLVDFDGPLNLAGALVTFKMRAYNTVGASKVSAPATVVDAAAGLVQYDWLPADTNTVGFFTAEWHVVMPSGKPITFPNDGFILVSVVDNCG